MSTKTTWVSITRADWTRTTTLELLRLTSPGASRKPKIKTNSLSDCVYRRHYKRHNYTLLLCLKRGMDSALDFRMEFVERDKFEHAMPCTQRCSYTVDMKQKQVHVERKDYRHGAHTNPNKINAHRLFPVTQ